jgi:hypothetical protein
MVPLWTVLAALVATFALIAIVTQFSTTAAIVVAVVGIAATAGLMLAWGTARKQ